MDKKIPKILFISRDNSGCGFYRCTQPASFLKRAGHADARAVLSTATPEELLESDLVVIQAMGSVEIRNISKFCIKNNIPYVVEIDDFLHHVSPNNLGGYPAWNPSTLYLHRTTEIMKSGLGLIVSTPWLAREYHPYHPSVFVFPNYLDKDKWTNPIVKKLDGKIRIGWAGGNAHTDDLRMISRVIEKIVKEFKGKVVFETFGMTKQELIGVFQMEEFSEICPSCGYEGQKHHYAGEIQENYPLALASKGWDIALAPVISNSFGNAKSDLKIKEYAASGMAIVASRVDPYLESAKNGAQIAFADTFDEWYNEIRLLIKNKQKRESIVKANKEWVEQYWIQDNIGKIAEVYQQLITSFSHFKKNSVI